VAEEVRTVTSTMPLSSAAALVLRSVFAPSLAALSLLLLTAFLPSPAAAYFEHVETSARATSFGGAYSAIADDASAAYYNPAAMVAMNRSEVLVMVAKPYNISGYQSSYIGAVLPREGVSLGAYWHHTGVSDVMSENLAGVSFGRDLLPPGGNVALAIGGTLKLAQVGYSQDGDADYGSQTKFTADISTLLNVTEKLAFSYTLQNLLEPEFDFVSGNGGTSLARRNEVGASYRWNPASTVALAVSQNAFQEWRFHLGGEVWFQDVFSVRSGFIEGAFAGGVGLNARTFLVDMAFLTNEALGVSYEVSLRIPFGDTRW
jgi:hypothetical protein